MLLSSAASCRGGQRAGEKSVTGDAERGILRSVVRLPAGPSIGITTDIFCPTARELPRWNTISISGYRTSREAGSTTIRARVHPLERHLACVEASVCRSPEVRSSRHSRSLFPALTTTSSRGRQTIFRAARDVGEDHEELLPSARRTKNLSSASRRPQAHSLTAQRAKRYRAPDRTGPRRSPEPSPPNAFDGRSRVTDERRGAGIASRNTRSWA